MTALAETLNRVSTAAYQASASEAGPTNGSRRRRGPGGRRGPRRGRRRGRAAGEAPQAEGEEAVEGEFKEV